MNPKQSFEFILEMFELEGELPLAAPYASAYDYLVEQGLIAPVEKRKNRFEEPKSKRSKVEEYLKQKL